MHPIWMFLPRTDFACHLMQALTLPAKRGSQWLIEGLEIFRMKPALLTLIVFGYLMTMIVVSMIPYAGKAIGFMLIPVFSVSLMNACRVIDNKRTPPPLLLFSGFHQNLPTLFSLGVVYIASTVVALGAASLVDDGQLFRALFLGEVLSDEAMAKTSVQIAAQIIVVLLVPVVMAFWFAPVLAAWHDMSAGKSLFFSLVACARNWRAFLIYVLALGVLCIFVPGMLVAILTVTVGPAMAGFLTMIFSLMLWPTVYASFYVSYRDVFAKQRDEA